MEMIRYRVPQSRTGDRTCLAGKCQTPSKRRTDGRTDSLSVCPSVRLLD